MTAGQIRVTNSSRDNLLAHQVTATFSLHLVLDVHASNTGADILVDCASNHGSSTKADAKVLAEMTAYIKCSYPVSASAMTGVLGFRLQTICAL
jgi:hypothetical protein